MEGKERDGSAQSQAGRFLGVGMTWALSTALFLYLGRLVDGWLGTDPLFTVVGVFVGSAAGFYYLYHEAVIRPRERAKLEAAAKPKGPE